MLRGTISNGFKYEIEEQVLDDMELLELIGEVDEDGAKLPKLLDRLLGREQKKALYDSLRTEKGNVPVGATVDALKEIFEQNGETKNS